MGPPSTVHSQGSDAHHEKSNKTLKKDAVAVLGAIESAALSGRSVVCQVAPAFLPALSEEFGLKPGTFSEGQIITALRSLGFQQVFDLRFAADVTIMEEASELLERVKAGGPFPMFTSCCAGWMQYAETTYPDLLHHLSSAKSPMAMCSAIVKSYYAKCVGRQPEEITVVSLMPCSIKKQEAKRRQLCDEYKTDFVLTTREVGEILRQRNYRWEEISGSGSESTFSSFASPGSGAGQLFGVTGGVMEAAIRSAYEFVAKEPFPGVVFEAARGLEAAKESKVSIPGLGDLNICVVSGATNVKRMMDQTRAGECPFHFVEIMMCSGGCINGPGQPRSDDPHIVQKRMQALYSTDERSVIRKSHDNPAVRTLYADYLERPLSQRSHHLLHTHFTSQAAAASEPDSDSDPAARSDSAVVPLAPEATGRIDNVVVLFGSETGNSEGVARSIAKDFTKRGATNVRCAEADSFEVDELEKVSWLVVVISTAGQGDFPENAKEFWEALSQRSKPSDLLKNTKFAVFGLGDSSYPMFCQAAKLVDRRLAALGGSRVVPRGVGDDQHEERFETGLGEWLPQLWDTLRLPEPENMEIPEPNYRVVLTKVKEAPLKRFPSSTTTSEDGSGQKPIEVGVAAVESGSLGGAGDAQVPKTTPRLMYSEEWKPIVTDKHGFLLKLVTNERITHPSYDRDVRHLVFDLSSHFFKYAVGDCLAIFPRNDPAEAADFISEVLHLDPTDLVSVSLKDPATFDGKPVPPLKPDRTLQDLFTDVLDVFGRPNARFLKELIKFAKDATEASELHLLSSPTPAGKAAYSKLTAETPNFADILRMFPSTRPSLPHILELIPVIKPRYYSVASSQHLLGNTLELCIVVNDWTTASGAVKIGTCTDYVRKLTGGPHYVSVALRASAGLCMPFNPKIPLVMAGIGTGLAPMRAMVQEREYQLSRRAPQDVGESVLFFGCRHRSKDYLYGEHWEQYLRQGVLTDLRVAFSRDQARKVYIQNKIEEAGEVVWDLLGVKGGYFMYCGSAGQVPKDIRNAIEGAFVKFGGMTKPAATAKIDAMIRSGHYVVEAWT